MYFERDFWLSCSNAQSDNRHTLHTQQTNTRPLRTRTKSEQCYDGGVSKWSDGLITANGRSVTVPSHKRSNNAKEERVLIWKVCILACSLSFEAYVLCWSSRDFRLKKIMVGEGSTSPLPLLRLLKGRRGWPVVSMHKEDRVWVTRHGRKSLRECHVLFYKVILSNVQLSCELLRGGHVMYCKVIMNNVQLSGALGPGWLD